MKIIRHPFLYKDPVGFVKDWIWAQWKKTGGSKLVFLFPTQAIMEFWEEQLLPVLGSWGGARFLLVDGLVREIINETRPGIIDFPPGSGSLFLRLFTEELIALEKIKYLSAAIPSPSLYSSMREELLLLKRAGIDPVAFANLAADGSQALKDLSFLYEGYQQFMEEHKLADAEEKIRLATIDVVKSSWLRTIEHLYVLGFTDFTAQQEDLLRKISKTTRVTIVFDHSIADRKGLFPPALKGGGVRDELVIPSKVRKTPTLLGYLQTTLWTEKPALAPPGVDSSIRLIKAKGGWRREIAYLAQEIKRVLTIDPNLSPDQIGVVTPYPLGTVYQIFAAQALPVTTRINQPLIEQPAARALLQPFQVVLTDFSWLEMIKYLRWGGISTKKELYAMVPPSTLEGWKGELANTFLAHEEAGHKVNGLLELLTKIASEGTLQEYLEVCLQWVTHPLLLTGFLPNSLTPEPYLKERFFQTSLLGKIKGLIENTRDSIFGFSRKKMSLKDFYLILEFLLGMETVQQPTSWENGIRLLSPQDARGISFKHTFFAGLNEGVFPRIKPEGWLLREEEIKHWPVEGLLPKNVDQLSMERLLFYYVINTPQEKLILSYCETDQEGQPLNPSSFLEDLVTLLPTLKEELQVASYKGFFLKQPATKKDLKREIADKIALERERRTGKLLTTGVMGEKEQKILTSSFTREPMSVSALEEYAACPFAFFCRRWLQLETLLEPEVLPNRLEEGSIYHQVLKEFFSGHRGEVLRRSLLGKYLEEIRALALKHYPEAHESAPILHRNFLELGRENFILRLEKVIKEEVEWAEKTDGRFTARYLELGFGGIKKEADQESTEWPLVLTEETTTRTTLPLHLWGKIDRVDTDTNGRFIIYDYKSGNPPLFKQIQEGKLLQLPLYLLAVIRLILPTREPVGAAYYSLNKTNRLRGIWRQVALDFGIKIRGALDDGAWEDLIANSTRQALQYYRGILRGDFPFCSQEQCSSYCEFRTICRRTIWGKEAKVENEAE